LPKPGSGVLLRAKTRKPGKAPIAADKTAQVVALTCAAPPHPATHWTGRAMAKAMGLSLSSVQRIWRAHQLQPHRLRTFKRSRDPGFAAIDPPAHAMVLSIDEKSQIQRCYGASGEGMAPSSLRTNPTGVPHATGE
jgi:hypothetical protein